MNNSQNTSNTFQQQYDDALLALEKAKEKLRESRATEIASIIDELVKKHELLGGATFQAVISSDELISKLKSIGLKLAFPIHKRRRKKKKGAAVTSNKPKVEYTYMDIAALIKQNGRLIKTALRKHFQTTTQSLNPKIKEGVEAGVLTDTIVGNKNYIDIA